MAAPIINFSGIASGIDSSSLIQAILDQERQASVKPLQDKITSLTDTNTAFDDLKTSLAKLNDAASKFRVLNGTALAKQGISSDDSIVNASTSNSASNGTYSITVSQMAKNATYSFKSSAATYTSTSDTISSGSNFSDTVQIKVGNPSSPVDDIIVNVDQNTTLDQFVSQFNSSATGAVASAVNVGTAASPDYRIVINTNKTGTAEGQVQVTVGATLSGRNAFNQNSVDNAANAVFNLGGIGNNITRATNSVSDVIPGVTFNLRSQGSATISVSDDSSTTTQSVQDFVDAYNDLRQLVADKNQITKVSDAADALNVFGPLAQTSIDDNAMSAIRSAFFSSSLTGNTINTLSDLGITTQRDGSLAFDTTVFANALSSDPESARSIFSNLGENLSSVNGTIAQFTQYQGLIDQAKDANTNQISDMNIRISETEKNLSDQQSALTQRFSRLESLIGQMNSQQSIISKILPVG